MARWSINIKHWADRTKGDMNAAVRAMSLEIFAKIIVRSPVDTGRFRGNWMIGVQVVPTGYQYEEYDPAGAKALGEGEKNLIAYALGDRISFRNNLPYSVALERGHSGQAPYGMVRVTLQEAGAISRRAVRKARSGT